MKLLDSNQVCRLLGISRSTLYRWCNLSKDDIYFPDRRMRSFEERIKMANEIDRDLDSENITDFPTPYKIGRALKWSDIEIDKWLRSKKM